MSTRLSRSEQVVLAEAAQIVLALRCTDPTSLPPLWDATATDLLRLAAEKLWIHVTAPWPDPVRAAQKIRTAVKATFRGMEG